MAILYVTKPQLKMLSEAVQSYIGALSVRLKSDSDGECRLSDPERDRLVKRRYEWTLIQDEINLEMRGN